MLVRREADIAKEFSGSDAVFIGTVASIRVESTAKARNLVVTMRIDDAFKGVSGTSVEVITGLGGGDCGFEFREGHQYLVYADRLSDGRLYTGICSLTQFIGWALPQLRWLSSRRASR